MADLSLVFPQPRSIAAGGELWSVQPLRLMDLAALEASLAGPGALDGRRGALAVAAAACRGDACADSDEGRAYATLLRGAFPACAGWCASLGSPEARDQLATLAGRAIWFLVVLGRGHPGFGANEAVALLSRIQPEEEASLGAAAWGLLPIGEWAAMVAPDPPGQSARSWAEAICHAAGDDPAKIEAIGRMTVGQWRLWRSGGTARPGEPSGDRARVRVVNARKRRVLAPPDR